MTDKLNFEAEYRDCKACGRETPHRRPLGTITHSGQAYAWTCDNSERHEKLVASRSQADTVKIPKPAEKPTRKPRPRKRATDGQD